MTNRNARHLRKNLTDAERLLWSRLRNRQLENHRFRRQHPIGPYIVDFVCLDKALIIELDGGQHGEDGQIAYDQERTVWLETEGYKVIRFWNYEVFELLDDVLSTIYAHLIESTNED